MAQSIWDFSRRIVFEHGVSAIKDPNWRLLRSEDSASVPIGVVQHECRLSPILIELEGPYPEPAILLLPDGKSLLTGSQSRALDVEIAEVVQKAVKDGRVNESRSIQYSAGAAMHHCKRMAEYYGATVSRFVPRAGVNSKREILGALEELFYEFDAFISAAIRTLDALRGAIWRQYGGAGSLPSSFKRTIDRCERLPKSLKVIIDDAWQEYFSHAKEYRDCIQHYYSPGTSRPPYSFLQLQDVGLWTMSVWIPENPETRSLEKFTYKKRVDALSYAWSLTTRVVQIARAICDG